ncbi:metallophosphoesterase [Pelomonas sp. KK5]|uniref:metallophosphoesterase family protein n=1 Tax=Pelomonas sp. KK5 TaxID=1855730 RepID=UPI00097BFE99|nr:metallophosphoesterase family protein [Pelomonas sp. KK5]
MSKMALITDVHANRQALEAVLEHARANGAREYAFLGDLVGYGSDPAWVVDTVAAYQAQGAVVIMGNHDEAALAGDSDVMHEDARQAQRWTHAHLSRSQLEFLASLPMSAQRGDCLFVHANAWAPKDWGYITGRIEAMRSLHATTARYTFCGHMHEPMLYHLSGTGKAGDFKPVPGVPIPLLSHRQWLVIPGSCGQPRDGNPAACYALFDPRSQELSFERVPYDAEAAAAGIRAAGLPERLADRLLVGQ